MSMPDTIYGHNHSQGHVVLGSLNNSQGSACCITHALALHGREWPSTVNQ